MTAYVEVDDFRSASQVRIDKLAEERRARGELDEEDGGLDFDVSDEDAFGDDLDDGDDEDWTVEGEDELEIEDFDGEDEEDEDEDEDGKGGGKRSSWDDDEDAQSLFQYIK
jgi:hypothetical protein